MSLKNKITLFLINILQRHFQDPHSHVQNHIKCAQNLENIIQKNIHTNHPKKKRQDFQVKIFK